MPGRSAENDDGAVYAVYNQARLEEELKSPINRHVTPSRRLRTALASSVTGGGPSNRSFLSDRSGDSQYESAKEVPDEQRTLSGKSFGSQFSANSSTYYSATEDDLTHSHSPFTLEPDGVENETNFSRLRSFRKAKLGQPSVPVSPVTKPRVHLMSVSTPSSPRALLRDKPNFFSPTMYSPMAKKSSFSGHAGSLSNSPRRKLISRFERKLLSANSAEKPTATVIPTRSLLYPDSDASNPMHDTWSSPNDNHVSPLQKKIPSDVSRKPILSSSTFQFKTMNPQRPVAATNIDHDALVSSMEAVSLKRRPFKANTLSEHQQPSLTQEIPRRPAPNLKPSLKPSRGLLGRGLSSSSSSKSSVAHVPRVSPPTDPIPRKLVPDKARSSTTYSAALPRSSFRASRVLVQDTVDEAESRENTERLFKGNKARMVRRISPYDTKAVPATRRLGLERPKVSSSRVRPLDNPCTTSLSIFENYYRHKANCLPENDLRVKTAIE